MSLQGRIKAFTYVTAEKAQLYRSILRVCIESKDRFVFQLRVPDIIQGVHRCGLPEISDAAEVEAALEQLCEWGNLETRPDMAAVSSVEDFYRQRNVFEITDQGEAVERALDAFRSGSPRHMELPSEAAADVRDLLLELKGLLLLEQPDTPRIRRGLLALWASFRNMAGGSQAFMSDLRARIDLRPAGVDEAIVHLQRLIDHIENFSGVFLMACEDIAGSIQEIENTGPGKLFQSSADRECWTTLRSWFLPETDSPAYAEVLRARLRASTSIIFSIMTGISGRQAGRTDRANDFLVLARWFAEASSDADAHRLWRSVFGLSPARHLIVNEATLDDHEAHGVSPGTSWLEAPPLHISNRLRSHGNRFGAGSLSRIVDRTAEKQKLADAARKEMLRLSSAQSRFITGRRMRLSEFEQAGTGEFDVLLDLLGEAVSAKVYEYEVAEMLSSDGCLRITLEPPDDGGQAVIHTAGGIFAGPDFWITVEPAPAEEVVR